MKQFKILLNYFLKGYFQIPIYLRAFVIFFVLVTITFLINKYYDYQYSKNSIYIPEEEMFMTIDEKSTQQSTKTTNNNGVQTNKKITIQSKETLKSAPSLRKNNNKTEEYSSTLSTKEIDYFFGNDDAPITIIEYSNFKCPYCIKFHENNMEEIKTNYIDTGKVKYIKRIIIQKDTLIGIMLPYCAPQENKYLLLRDLYSEIREWTNPIYQNKVLKNIALKNGFTEKSYEACIKNSILANKLLTKQQNELKALNIYSTPTIFINNEKIKGNMPFKEFSSKIDKELQKVKK